MLTVFEYNCIPLQAIRFLLISNMKNWLSTHQLENWAKSLITIVESFHASIFSYCTNDCITFCTCQKYYLLDLLECFLFFAARVTFVKKISRNGLDMLYHMNLFLFINIVLIYFDDISSHSHDFHVEESFAESKFSEWKDRQNFIELIFFFNEINYPLS